MKPILFLLAMAALAASSQVSAQMLSISEVYGGGGNSGSTYKNDFIELYNYGSTTIDLSTLAVYYTSSTGTFSASAPANNFSTLLTGTLAPSTFYLIQEAPGTGGTTNLSNVNVVGTIAMSSSAGKVALGLASTTPSSTAGAITDTSVIDFIGYGAAANQFEGTAPAPGLSNTTSDSRTVLTSNAKSNSSDFAAGAPNPVGSGPVPEPSTWVSLAGGLGLLSLVLRQRRIA